MTGKNTDIESVTFLLSEIFEIVQVDFKTLTNLYGP